MTAKEAQDIAINGEWNTILSIIKRNAEKGYFWAVVDPIQNKSNIDKLESLEFSVEITYWHGTMETFVTGAKITWNIKHE